MFYSEIEIFRKGKGHIMLYIGFQTVKRSKKQKNTVDD